MVRILFVDDDANLLSGMRRALRRHRDVWDLHFATGGQEALATIAEVTPDIVADTRWFRSPKVGVVSLSVRKQISYRASLSMQTHSSAPLQA